MRRGWKRALRIGLGVLVGLVLLALIVPPFINLDSFKPMLAEQVKALTGRDIAIDGDISVFLLPRPGVAVEQLSLSNAPGFGDEPMLRVQRVKASVRWLPLVTGAVQPTGVVVDGLDVRLVRDGQGNGNWQDLLEIGGAGEPAAQSGTPSFAMGSVRVREASITFEDRQAGARYALTPLDVTVDGFRSGSTADFELSCRYELDGPDLRGPVRLSGELSPDLELGRYLVTAVDLAAEATGAVLPEGKADVMVRIQRVAVDLGGGSLEVGGFEADANGLRMVGDASAEQIDADPTARAELKFPACDLRETLRSLGMELATSDPGALGKVAGNLFLKYEGGILTVEPLALTLDDSTAEGEAVVDGPLTTFSLAVDRLNLDRYLPPPDTGQELGQEHAPVPEPKAIGEPADIASLVRALNVEGELRVGTLLVSGMEMRDVTVTVVAKDGDLDLGPVEASQ